MQQTHGCSRDINLQKLQKWSTAFTVDTVKILLPPMFTASVMKARIMSRLIRGRNTGSKNRRARGATDGNRWENPRLGNTNVTVEGREEG